MFFIALNVSRETLVKVFGLCFATYSEIANVCSNHTHSGLNMRVCSEHLMPYSRVSESALPAHRRVREKRAKLSHEASSFRA
jgi:hypothetical protein